MAATASRWPRPTPTTSSFSTPCSPASNAASACTAFAATAPPSPSSSPPRAPTPAGARRPRCQRYLHRPRRRIHDPSPSRIMILSALRSRAAPWYVGFLAPALLVYGAPLYFGVQADLRTELQHSLRGEA